MDHVNSLWLEWGMEANISYQCKTFGKHSLSVHTHPMEGEGKKTLTAAAGCREREEERRDLGLHGNGEILGELPLGREAFSLLH